MKGGINTLENQLKVRGAQDSLYAPKPQKGLVNSGEDFKKALGDLQSKEKIFKETTASQGLDLKFSNHAVERMLHRGIHFSGQDLARLDQAISKADAKGAKDTLVLLNESALIVSVKNKTVVTVMDKNALKENVFTNIDSTVVI